MKKKLTKYEKRQLRRKEREEERRREWAKRKRKEKTRKMVSWGLIIFAVAIIAYVFVGFLTSEKKPDVKYSKGDENVPRIQVTPQYYDFGDVSVRKGTVVALLTVKNVGKNDLIIDYMETSCMCTEASLVVDGKEGPKFGMRMHGTNPVNWWKSIPPGGTAKLKVYYNPKVHRDLRGALTRVITIHSNDPYVPQKEVRIEAYQVS